MIAQILIAVCGMASVWLSQDQRQTRRRWACIFGLVAQPAWMWSTWEAGQWGIFALSFVYTAGWLRGIWGYWIEPRIDAAIAALDLEPPPPRVSRVTFDDRGLPQTRPPLVSCTACYGDEPCPVCNGTRRVRPVPGVNPPPPGLKPPPPPNPPASRVVCEGTYIREPSGKPKRGVRHG